MFNITFVIMCVHSAGGYIYPIIERVFPLTCLFWEIGKGMSRMFLECMHCQQFQVVILRVDPF